MNKTKFISIISLSFFFILSIHFQLLKHFLNFFFTAFVYLLKFLLFFFFCLICNSAELKIDQVQFKTNEIHSIGDFDMQTVEKQGVLGFSIF